jgi:hypothetical protein|tara:strand:- start:21 stop:482 length:462 start_codon:yes stop_codon:yes gene_type:complete
MKKSNFKYHIRLRMSEELDKGDIRGVITVLKSTIAGIFQPLEDGTAVIYHLRDEEHVYDFRLNRGVTEEEAEVILGLITDWTEADFVMEITTSKDYDIPEGETEINLTAMKHNRWISNKVSDGWRYGLQYDKTALTDPRLRPYHELTDKLKNI